MMCSEKKVIVPLKFEFYYYPFVLIVICGLIDSVYLFYSHFRNFTDISYISFCAISRAINCDTVAQSRYSIFMGLPVSLWGIAGYCFLLFLSMLRGNKSVCKKGFWSLIFFICLAYSLFSLYLAFVSLYLINSYCIMCILSYALCIGSLFYSWIIHRRFENKGLLEGFLSDVTLIRKNSVFFICTFVIVLYLSAAFLLLPKYWLLDPSSPSAEKLETGITPEGFPWIGAKYPKLTITLFSDYQCFQCRKMHFFLRKIIEANKDKIRLICRNYPLDNEFNNIVAPEAFHVGSGKLSLIATYSIFKGRFWDVSDSLYKIKDKKAGKKDFSVEDIADITGLDKNDIVIALNHPEIRERLRYDIIEGMRLKITSTPAILINGKVYLGQIPEKIIKKAIDNNASENRSL